MNFNDILDIVSSIFTLIGALKVLARFTPWKWDDKVLDIISCPARLFKK